MMTPTLFKLSESQRAKSIGYILMFALICFSGRVIADSSSTSSDNISNSDNQPPFVETTGPSIVELYDQFLTESVYPIIGDDSPVGQLEYQWTALGSNANKVSIYTTNISEAVIQFWAVGDYAVELRVSDGEFTVRDTMFTTVINSNKPPQVNIGPDVVLQYPNNTLKLDPQVTDDGLGRLFDFPFLDYSWYGSGNGGASDIRFDNPLAKSPTVTFQNPGNYTLYLTVNDGELLGTDEVNVLVLGESTQNKAPVVNSGFDASVSLTLPENTLKLNGSAIDDGLPNNSLTYLWKVVDGVEANVSIGDPSDPGTTVSFSMAGNYRLQLDCSDGELTGSDQVLVKVNSAIPVNQAPIANAGNDTQITLPINSYQLNGSASDDLLPNNTLTYKWTATGANAGNVSFDNDTKKDAIATFSAAGIYSLELIANDGELASNPDEVVITVNEELVSNIAPVANAGPDQVILDQNNNGDELVSLDGSASSDADGSIATYEWFENDNLLETGAKPQILLGVGEHTIVLKVTDDKGASSEDIVQISIKSPPIGSIESIFLEAECASSIGNRHSEIEDSKASGGKALRAGTFGMFLSSAPTNAVYKMVFNINIAAEDAGAYYFFGRLIATGGTDDSYWFTLNDETPIKWNNMPRSPEYQWVTLFDDDQANDPQVVLNLKAGLNTIVITYREPGITLDKVVLTKINQAPSGIGEVASNCDTETPVNELPIADAGPDQTVEDTDGNGLETINLDGSASFDPDGNIVSYEWSKGNQSLANGQTPTISLAVGTHLIKLTVRDNDGASASNEVSITVNNKIDDGANQAPVADAGLNQNVLDNDGNGLEDITLDASGSEDPDGTIVSYSWEEYGQEIATGVSPTISLTVGIHNLELTVTDNEGAKSSDVVRIEIGKVSGTTEFMLEAECANTVGSNFVEVDDTYAYSTKALKALEKGSFFTAPPEGDEYKITFLINLAESQAGTYYFFGYVRPEGGSADSYWVSINDGTPIKWNNMPYKADSYGPSWQWVYLFDDNQSGDPQLTIDLQAGVNKITICYREPNISIDKILISQKNETPDFVGRRGTNCDGVPVNIPPVAEAGLNIEKTDVDDNGSEVVSLDASASSDTDGSIDAYTWRENGQVIASGINPEVTLNVGVHTIVLEVIDDQGAMDTDQLTVNILSGDTSEPPVGNTIKLEAECAQLGANFGIVSGSDLSNGQAVKAINGQRFISGANESPANLMTFSFNIGEAGTYEIYTRVKALSASFDSYWVRIDNGDWIKFNEITATKAFVIEQLFDSDQGKATVSVPLTAGVHTITFAYREPDVELDFITISSEGEVPANAPGITGINCGNNQRIGSLGESIELYPNPAGDLVNLRINGQKEGWYTVRLIDLAGKVIRTYNFKKGSKQYELEMKLQDLANGVYMISIETDEDRDILRLMHMN